MKWQGLVVVIGWGGFFFEFVVVFMKLVGILDGICWQKGRLIIDYSDLEVFRDKWQEVYFDLGIKFNLGGGIFDDIGFYCVEDIVLKFDFGSFVKCEYGVEFIGEDVW